MGKTKTSKDVGKYLNNNIKSLKKKVDKELRYELKEIGDKVVEDIQKYIISEWYDKYIGPNGEREPINYTRTYSLTNAIRYNIDSKNKMRVYFDRRFFKTYISKIGEWNPHRSFDGEVFIEGLIDFLSGTEAMKGSKWNPRRGDRGIDLVEKANQVATDYANTLISKKLSIIVKQSMKK